MHSTTFFLALIAASTAIAVPLRDGATTDIVDKRNNHLGARDAAAAAAGSASRKKTGKKNKTKAQPAVEITDEDILSDETIQQVADTLKAYGGIVNAETLTDPSDADSMAALKAQVQSLPDYQKTAISKMIDVATQLDEIFDTFTLQDQRAVQRKVLLTLTPIQEAFLTLALTKNFDDKALAADEQDVKLTKDEVKQFRAVDAKRRMELIEYTLAADITEEQINYIEKLESSPMKNKKAGKKGSKKKHAAAKAGNHGSGRKATKGVQATQATQAAPATQDDDDDDDDDEVATNIAKRSHHDDDDDDDDSDSDSDSDSDDDDDADVQQQINCLSKDDANDLLKNLKAQGATSSQLSQAKKQIPSLSQKHWKRPSSCPKSKRSLADLD